MVPPPKKILALALFLALTALAAPSAPGSLLEKALTVIDRSPPDQPGPNPGYIGVTFRAGSQAQNLWFTRTRAGDLRKQGLKGADFYRARANRP